MPEPSRVWAFFLGIFLRKVTENKSYRGMAVKSKKLVVSGMCFVFVLAFVLLQSQKNREKKYILKVASNTWLGYEPFHLAEYLGFYKESDIRLVRLSSATQVIRSYRNNQVDAVMLTLDEALKLQEMIDDFQIVMVTDISNGADAVIADKSIKTLADLKGKVIGLEKTALGAYILERTLEIAQLEHKDVTVRHLEVYQHYDSFVNGDLDAVITFEPSKNKILQRRGHVLLDSIDLENEILDVVVVRKKVIKEHPDLLRSFLAGWSNSLKMIERKDQKSQAYLQMTLSLNEAGLLKAYKGLKLISIEKNMQILTVDIVKILKRTQKILLAEKFLNQQKDLSELINTNMIKNL